MYGRSRKRQREIAFGVCTRGCILLRWLHLVPQQQETARHNYHGAISQLWRRISLLMASYKEHSTNTLHLRRGNFIGGFAINVGN